MFELARPTAPFDEELAECITLWDAVCLLLRRWRLSLPREAARDATGSAYARWADLRDETYAHFAGGRAPTDFGDVDRAFIARGTRGGVDIDGVDAIAWGLASATNHTFASAWARSLGSPDRHTLEAGDPYPVADPLWPFPKGDVAARPDSLTRPRIDELPFVRVHDDTEFDLTVDFRFARRLKRILAQDELQFAALHPNRDWAELVFPLRGREYFPVGPVDEDGQRGCSNGSPGEP